MLHALVPHVPDLAAGTRELIAYRSRLDGTWFVSTPFDGGVLVRDEDTANPQATGRNLRAARAFKASVEARGARLVLTLVPAPAGSRARAEDLAEYLGVPLVAPAVAELATFDGSHLTPESAARFASAFVAELDAVLPALDLPAAAPAGESN